MLQFAFAAARFAVPFGAPDDPFADSVGSAAGIIHPCAGGDFFHWRDPGGAAFPQRKQPERRSLPTDGVAHQSLRTTIGSGMAVETHGGHAWDSVAIRV